MRYNVYMTPIASNVFTDNQIAAIYDSINKEFDNREVVEWYDSAMGHEYPKDKKFIAIKKEGLSRLDIDRLNLPDDVIMSAKLSAIEIANKIGVSVKDIVGVTYVEYSPKYGGSPFLNPHKDAEGESEFILDYQLDANTDWDIGINKDIYSLNNNDALGILTTKNYHWRKKKDWNPDEYVKMLFFHIVLEDKNIKDSEYSKEEIFSFAEQYNGGKNETR